MESFLVAVNAVVPFTCYLLLGYLAQRTNSISQEMFRKMSPMAFRWFYPFLSFYNIYNAERGAIPSLKVMLLLPFGIVGTQLVLLAVLPHFVKENSRRGTLIQALTRSNYVLLGMSLAVSVLGEQAASALAMTLAVVVTTFNVSCVIILELFNDTGVHNTSAKKLVVNLLKNPMLEGCFFGLAFFFLGIQLPACLEAPVRGFANLTTPFALFVLGGTLRVSSVKHNLKYLVPGLFFKLIGSPAIWIAAAYAIGIRKAELFCVFAAFASPVATASYPMAESMGGDGELAGQFVVLSTILSVFTLFGWIFLLESLGLF